MRALLVILATAATVVFSSACGPSAPPASSANGAPASTSTGCGCHAQPAPPETK